MTQHRHIIHHFEGNPLEIPIQYRFLKNFLIRRAYQQFWRKDSAIAPEWLSEKIHMNVLQMNVLYWLKMVCSMFTVQKFEFFWTPLPEPLGSHFS